MPTLTITRGLPGSGKTTWAKTTGAARLNRDDMRHTVFGSAGILAWEQEQRITALQQGAARELLASGYDVVIDDMNLRAKYARAWADLALAAGATFAVQDFIDVPIETCIARDAARERVVGEKVIRELHGKFLASGRLPAVAATPQAATAVRVYEPDETLPPAWLVDVDGTLALMGDRGPFDWARVGEDRPNPAVIELATHLANEAALIVMSGRDEVCRPETQAWLVEHFLQTEALLMRPAGDQRKDSIVKAELFWQHVAPKWNVRGVIDDRQQVVDMWRAMGLMCAQVAPGAF